MNITRVTDAIRQRTGNPRFAIKRFPRSVIEEMVAHLEGLVDRQSGRFSRDLTPIEQAFIDNELMLCQLDFRHFCENYAIIELASDSEGPEGFDLLQNSYEGEADAGGRKRRSKATGKFLLNGMQVSLIAKLAELEEICHQQMAAGQPVNGILLIILKARQLGASMLFQTLLRHRVNFFANVNSITASIDHQSTLALQRRSDRIHENMPVWMRAAIKTSSQDTGIVFENGSAISLQDGSQKKDLGKGETWHAGHITEASVFQRPEDNFDEGLFPAIPNMARVLFGMETTAKGKVGWFYDFCTAVMSGTAEGGAGRFSFFFAPFYLIDAYSPEAGGQASKYRLQPPEGWEPTPNTKRVAAEIEATSHDYTPDHMPVRLDREVLYWYETLRAAAYKRGKLNIFLQSYPITPNEAFQHSSAGAFTTETIELLERKCAEYEPWPYKLLMPEERDSLPSESVVLQVGQYAIGPMQPYELDRDPRGIIYLWELPVRNATYYCSSDPTGGIPKWNRAFRKADDVNTDNGVVHVFRKNNLVVGCDECSGLGWRPTEDKAVQIECSKCDGRGRVGGRGVQVAEFAAPIDAEELALYVWLLSNLYRGDSDMEECLTIVEANNTGVLTIRKLQETYKHTNLWQTESTEPTAGGAPKFLNRVGFSSTPTSVPVLHARGKSVLVRRDIEPRSKYLVKELSDAVVKVQEDSGRERFWVPPGAGRHDDRMTGMFLASWIMFPWGSELDGETATSAMLRELPAAADLARRDVTADQQARIWNDAAAAILDGYDLGFGHYDDCAADCTADHGADDASEPEFEEDALGYSYYDDDY